jgi:N utilization substance protein B
MDKCQIPNIGVIEMGIRRQAREIAVQALYMLEFHDSISKHEKLDSTKLIYIFDYFESPSACQPFAEILIKGVCSNQESIDKIISTSSQNWSLVRMARVDRALLRVATFELQYLNEIPRSVTINEAIEISKRYSSDDSPMFINGILDRIASSLTPEVSLEKVKDFEGAKDKKDSAKVDSTKVSDSRPQEEFVILNRR